MKLGKIIITLLFLCLLIFSVSHAVDEEWMMKKYPNWLPQMPDTGNFSFCFKINDQLLASSSYHRNKFYKQNNYQHLVKMFDWGHEENYNAFPNDSLSQALQEQIGDTLLLTDGKIYYRAIFESYGYFMGACDEFPAFGLNQIDSLPKDINHYDIYLVMPNNSNTFETIRAIKKVEKSDPGLGIYLDSIKNVVKNKVLEIEHQYIKSSYIDSFSVQYLEIENDTTRNSFFIRIDGFNLSKKANYHAVIYSHYYKGKQEYLFINESFNEYYEFNIVYAIHINDDKYIDYFVETGSGSSILTIRRNISEAVSYFTWSGC